jgi:hypothetical protein
MKAADPETFTISNYKPDQNLSSSSQKTLHPEVRQSCLHYSLAMNFEFGEGGWQSGQNPEKQNNSLNILLLY